MTSPATGGSLPPRLQCGRCAVELELGTATAAYLGHTFPVELLRCPRKPAKASDRRDIPELAQIHS